MNSAFKFWLGMALITGLWAIGGCVDTQKIDQTNQTLEKNLQELRVLNENFSRATERMDEIGRPMREMAIEISRMTKTIVDAGPEVLKGMEAAREIVALVRSIDPEQLRDLGQMVAEASEAYASINEQLAEMDTDLPTMVSQLGGGLQILSTLLPNMSRFSDRDRMQVENAVEDLATAGLELSQQSGYSSKDIEPALNEAQDEIIHALGLQGRPLELVQYLFASAQSMARLTPRIEALLAREEIDDLLDGAPSLIKQSADVDELLKRTPEFLKLAQEAEAMMKEFAVYRQELETKFAFAWTALREIEITPFNKYPFRKLPEFSQFPES